MWLPASGRVTRRSDRGDNRQLQYESVFRGYAIKRAFLVVAFRSCRRCARLALVPKRANLALFLRSDRYQHRAYGVSVTSRPASRSFVVPKKIVNSGFQTAGLVIQRRKLPAVVKAQFFANRQL